MKVFIKNTIATLLLTLIPPTSALALIAKVVSVHDGDTITVLNGKEQTKVRLYGIDAPEKKLGLWQSSNPTPPWEWRKR